MVKIDNMTQEEFKVLNDTIKEIKNLPNNKLEDVMDKINAEFEITKNSIISMSFYLDTLEEMYNSLLKEYKERNNG